MGDQFIAFDPSQDAGERLAPEVRAEIAVVAPSTVLANSISESKLQDAAVTTAKINAGAVTSSKIGTGEVKVDNIAAEAVTTAKLPDNAVTPAKVGTGVAKAVDTDDNPVEYTVKFMAAVDYAALGTPDPNVEYHIS